MHSFFKSKSKIDPKVQDQKLLYPYLDQKTIAEHPLIDEYNLARLYAIQNYLNHRFYGSKNHQHLKKYFLQNKTINWIGIVSDIKRPTSKYAPLLLIEKLAVSENGQAKLTENHVWLETEYIRNIAQPTQTIAVGDAIMGQSKIGAYKSGRKKSKKYELYDTIIKGAGIFVGQKPRNEQATDLTAKLVTDFDRHYDWILKLEKNTVRDATASKLAHVQIRYQDSNYPDVLSRIIITKRLEKRQKRKKNFNLSTLFNKIKVKMLMLLSPAVSYRAQFCRYTYINIKNGGFVPVITLQNIKDKNQTEIVGKKSFLINKIVLKLGQLKEDEDVIFKTKGITLIDQDNLGRLRSLQATEKKQHRSILPADSKAFVGFVMFNKNDQMLEHLPFLTEYKAWAVQHHIQLPKQKNQKLLYLKNKDQIAQNYQISMKKLKALLKKLNIHPDYISDNVPYYNRKHIRQVYQEIRLDKMLQKIHL